MSTDRRTDKARDPLLNLEYPCSSRQPTLLTKEMLRDYSTSGECFVRENAPHTTKPSGQTIIWCQSQCRTPGSNHAQSTGTWIWRVCSVRRSVTAWGLQYYLHPQWHGTTREFWVLKEEGNYMRRSSGIHFWFLQELPLSNIWALLAFQVTSSYPFHRVCIKCRGDDTVFDKLWMALLLED